jgi:hypothetical protein
MLHAIGLKRAGDGISVIKGFPDPDVIHVPLVR